MTGVGQPLPHPGAERQLEVQSGGNRGSGAMRPGTDVRVRSSDHLHHQTRVQRVHGINVLSEAIGVDIGGVRGNIAGDVVGTRYECEQVDVGA
ncbi:Uncharacterised protein [Mycobacteroides abscessus subsp. massiliense]|nr:Uncharacterised protein [Mycobacteroides abscessus subsp. massiliense]